MAYLKFFEGDKGGAGKSLVVQLMRSKNCWFLQLPSVAVEINKPSSDETVS